MKKESLYNKFPSTVLKGSMWEGWDKIVSKISEKSPKLTAFDCYPGVVLNEVESALKTSDAQFVHTSSLMKSTKEIEELTKRFVTDDILFGYITVLTMADYFDTQKLETFRTEVKNSNKNYILFGHGAHYVCPNADLLVFADMARWEIIQRFRRGIVDGIGVNNRTEIPSIQYKRGYFNDWRIYDKYKRHLMDKVDFWVDTHIANEPKMIDAETFSTGLSKTIEGPFRVVPFFDTAPWGGQWMKEVCNLDRDKTNYGWCFDCVPEENSLYLDVNGTRFEMPSINVVLKHPRALLGESVESRFGAEFPIRFDLLDTFGGGNLSLQVHPTTQYIRETFGMQYTQDESYYIIDAEENAEVYLGFKNGVDKDEMIKELHEAQDGKIVFDAEKYVNKFQAKKHDHYLIPGGTIHCSGQNALVLEISSTPNLFTFKLWDWERLGLDGKPRPINIEHGKNVLEWERDKTYTEKKLINNLTPIAQGDGWREESTGLHPNEFIEVRRHWFTKATQHQSNGSVHVIHLAQGKKVMVESPTKAFEPFAVHYAETFIIPASIQEYTITPCGDETKECVTLKAYVRF